MHPLNLAAASWTCTVRVVARKGSATPPVEGLDQPQRHMGNRFRWHTCALLEHLRRQGVLIAETH